MLQWGHDQLIVEGQGSPNLALVVYKLQWGHDQLIVEGHRAGGQYQPDARLQWGHDQLIVEGASSGESTGEHGVASMGPRSVDRGRQVAVQHDFRGRHGLQWGHDQLIVEGQPHSRAHRTLTKCFNGATIS